MATVGAHVWTALGRERQSSLAAMPWLKKAAMAVPSDIGRLATPGRPERRPR